MPNNDLQKLNDYFSKYIDRMLIRDIEVMKIRNDELRFSYPYILLVCSCIDFFGGIEKGFSKPDGQGNSRERFQWFITEWMAKVNPLYKEDGLASLIYDSWRCGLVHQATLKRGFEACSYRYCDYMERDKHLHLIKDEEGRNKRILIHALQFTDDFIEAQRMYRQYINDHCANISYLTSLNHHRLDMIREYKHETEQSFNQFINLLERRGLVFVSLETIAGSKVSSTSTVTTTTPSVSTITQLPSDDEEPIPSKAADEDK